MYTVSTLENTSFEQLADCFNRAFADYVITASVTADGLAERLRRANFKPELSAGAFSDGLLVGFITNAADDYCGELTAFDVGTGIDPEYRRRGLLEQMFELCTRNIKAAGISKYMLEVITTNPKAIKKYSDFGFQTVREYACFSGSADLELSSDFAIIILKLTDFDLISAQKLLAYSPSFEYISSALLRHADKCTAYFTEHDGDITAFIVADEKGAIKQAGCKPNCEDQLKHILAYVNQLSPKLTANNVDTRYTTIIQLLTSSGIKPFVNQFEMLLNV